MNEPMTQRMEPPICDHCNRRTRVFFCSVRPPASEYYCDSCHKSKRITNQQHIDFYHQEFLAGIKR